MKIIQEFKNFAVKGNVLDLAIGVIIGAAFGRIVTSFVDDIIMPPFAILTGGVDFSDKVWILKEATEGAQAITLNYGLFISSVVDFIIVAFSIFIAIRQINKFKKKEEDKKPEPKPSSETLLLTEIRDLLKTK